MSVPVMPPLIAFSALALVLIPLRWHWRAAHTNIGALTLGIWLAEANFFAGVSSVIWGSSVEIKYVWFCNIRVALQNMNIIGLVCSSLAIVRNLEHAASPAGAAQASGLKSTKKFDWFSFDVILCTAVLCLLGAAQYLVSPNEFNIYEGIGCQPAVFNSWPAVFIHFLPPLYLSFSTIVYAILVLQWLLLHRSQITRVLSLSSPHLPFIHFLRLLLLSVLLALYSLGFSSYQLIIALGGLNPWISWYNVHNHFDTVAQWPTTLFGAAFARELWVFWSIYPSAGLFYFFLFGLRGGSEDGIKVVVQKVHGWVKDVIMTTARRFGWQLQLGPPPVPEKDAKWLLPTSSFFSSDSESTLHGDVDQHSVKKALAPHSYLAPPPPAASRYPPHSLSSKPTSKPQPKSAAERYAAGDDLDFVEDEDDEIDSEWADTPRPDATRFADSHGSNRSSATMAMGVDVSHSRSSSYTLTSEPRTSLSSSSSRTTGSGSVHSLV